MTRHTFGPRLLWPNGYMDQDATGYGGRPWPTRHSVTVRWGPGQLPSPKGEQQPPSPNFSQCPLWPNGWMPLITEVGLGGSAQPHCIRQGPSSPRKGTAAPPLFSAHVYCGHGRPSQLLLSSCTNGRPKIAQFLTYSTEIKLRWTFLTHGVHYARPIASGLLPITDIWILNSDVSEHFVH